MRKVKPFSPALRSEYEKRRKQLEAEGAQDPESPMLPIEHWENGTVGKFYRPLKTAVSVRIHNDVLAWLKSCGEGHLTRINEILRAKMIETLNR